MRVAIIVLLLVLTSCSTVTRPRLDRRPVVRVATTSLQPWSVRIGWTVRNGADLEFVVRRQHQGHPWKVRATLVPDDAGRIGFLDTAAVPGETYTYGVTPAGWAEMQGVLTVLVPKRDGAGAFEP